MAIMGWKRTFFSLRRQMREVEMEWVDGYTHLVCVMARGIKTLRRDKYSANGVGCVN
jgi:hypothetical protein